jgi:hypothetical protein
MRRKNQCYIVTKIDGSVPAECMAYRNDICTFERHLVSEKVKYECSWYRCGRCTNPQARTDAASRLVKTLRRKYGVEE